MLKLIGSAKIAILKVRCTPMIRSIGARRGDDVDAAQGRRA
jgi:hypothetical protein